MWNLKHDTNEPIYETETDSQRVQTCGCQGGGREGWTGSLVLANANYYIQNGNTTRSYCISQGTIYIFNIL